MTSSRGRGLRLVALLALAAWLVVGPRRAGAQEAAVAAPVLPPIDLHGFVSEGGFVSTANNYIGQSARGSLEFFEAGLNVSTEIAPRLRAGLQVFTRAQGTLRDEALRLDWGFIDYRWRPWLGLRAGVVRMPFGLYNEYADIDAARLAILLPQSIYPVRNREALLAHTGFSLYGGVPIGSLGSLEYNAWLGTLNVPADALELNGASLHDVDTRYVTGAQVFWQPPVEGLRLGATFVRASIDFHLVIDPDQVAQLVAAGLVPPDYDGRLTIVQRPGQFWIASAELVRGDWLFAAEYSRATKHQRTTLPDLLPTIDEDAEHFYAMATYRLTARLDSGLYYSASHPDAAIATAPTRASPDTSTPSSATSPRWCASTSTTTGCGRPRRTSSTGPPTS